LDQIPKQILDHHLAVRGNTLSIMFDEMRSDRKTTKRDAAFNKKELDACCELLLAADISKTPLTMVHEFIESLPEPAANPPAAAAPAPVKAQKPKPKSEAPQPIQPCPKCGSEMVLRTAKQGARKGKQFYGCSKYPKCQKVINID